MAAFSDIKTCVAYLFSLTRKNRDQVDSLSYMRSLCAAYDHPERGLKYVHVTGTNGKGSVVSYLKEILTACGMKVGTFVSPHVSLFNERITYDGRMITDKEILAYAQKIVAGFPKLKQQGISRPGFFSLMTLMAFLYFSDLKPDIVIMEVGIGGALDSTNVINPLLALITNVAMDHMILLGNTLASVAANKLGIVKKKVPLVTLANPALLSQFQKRCLSLDSPLILVAQKEIKVASVGIAKTVFSYGEFKKVELQLLGKYQTENAALAIAACKVLRSRFKIPDSCILAGLKRARLPGRLEILKREPLIIVDGAHNPDAMLRLKEFILNFPGKHFTIVLAISSDKAKEKMIAIIEEVAERIIFTSYSYKRSEKMENLYNLSKHTRKETKGIRETVDEAYFDHQKDRIWIFTGSLYFAGEVRNLIHDLSCRPSPDF